MSKFYPFKKVSILKNVETCQSDSTGFIYDTYLSNDGSKINCPICNTVCTPDYCYGSGVNTQDKFIDCSNCGEIRFYHYSSLANKSKILYEIIGKPNA